jgi:biopolymer transport protein ExbB
MMMESSLTAISPWKIFMLGGVMMWPLLACSVLATTIVIQKFLYFHDMNKELSSLRGLVLAAVRDNDIKRAVQVCDASPSFMASVLKAGLFKYGAPRAEIARAMEDAASLEVPRLEQGLTVLSTIAGVAPLLGLLGTVIGLGNSFYIIQMRAAAMNPASMADISGGIWQALITTAAGLFIAAPVFMAYNYFVSAVRHTTHGMERAAAGLIGEMSVLTDNGNGQGEDEA